MGAGSASVAKADGDLSMTRSPPDYYKIRIPEAYCDRTERLEEVEVDAIALIEAMGLGFHLGCALKYIARAGKKTPDALSDINKAIDCLQRGAYLLRRGVSDD